MSPARAGTSAVVAVLGAAGLLLVLVTWSASIGPDRVVSGGHVERIRPDEPSSATASRHPRGRPGRGGPQPGARRSAGLGGRAGLRPRAPDHLRDGLPGAAAAPQAAPAVEGPRPGDVGARPRRSSSRCSARRPTSPRSSRRTRPTSAPSWPRRASPATPSSRAGTGSSSRRCARGVERRSWQTTAEFVLGALDLVAADRGAVGRLADLYREARFSDHPMTDEHRRAALEALDTIHRSLGRTTVAR